VLGRRPAPEFDEWLRRMAIVDDASHLLPASARHALVAPQLAGL
jgi:ethanolamine ammonia-lyase large subunit